jgi:hypothetical protein
MNARQLFDRAYARTVKAMNATLDPAHADECWKAVERYRGDVFDEVATRLNATCRFLPRPVEWLDACRAVQGERDMVRLREQELAAENYRRERTYHCLACLDSGLETIRCPTPPSADWCPTCKRMKKHLYDHTYRTPCSCRETNPVILARRDKAQRERLERQQARQGRAA